MAKRILYTQAVPDRAQSEDRMQVQRNVSKQGVVEGEQASTETVSLAPDQELLQSWFRGKYAQIMADEFEELFSAPGIDEVPFYVPNSNQKVNGYYSLENVQPQRGDPRTDKVHMFDGTYTRIGTRKTHWRAVRSAPEDVDNDFGSDSTEEVAIHERATDVRWFDETGGTTESATVQRNETGEFAHTDIYDTSEPSFNDPILIYSLPYEHEGRVDVRVWDDHNRVKNQEEFSEPKVGSSTVGSTSTGGSNTVSSWQKVFHPEHEFTGRVIVENGILRLKFYEDSGFIRARRWSEAMGDYEKVSLGSTDWRMRDIDLTFIGMHRVEAQVTFRDSSGTEYRLDLVLSRGQTSALWTQPTNESSNAPSDLQTRLDPVARTTDRDAKGDSTLFRREAVRK